MRSASETHCRILLFYSPLLLRESAASNGLCHLSEGGPRRSMCFEKGLPASMALWGRSRKSGGDGHQNFAVKKDWHYTPRVTQMPCQACPSCSQGL